MVTFLMPSAKRWLDWWEIRQTFSMFTVVSPITSLSLDRHFIKRPASTFFVTVEGDGMAGEALPAIPWSWTARARRART